MWSGRKLLDEIEYVLLGDAPAGAGAADLGEIYVVFTGEFAHERGRADIGVGIFFRFGSNDGCCDGGLERRGRGLFLVWRRGGGRAGLGGGGGPVPTPR